MRSLKLRSYPVFFSCSRITVAASVVVKSHQKPSSCASFVSIRRMKSRSILAWDAPPISARPQTVSKQFKKKIASVASSKPPSRLRYTNLYNPHSSQKRKSKLAEHLFQLFSCDILGIMSKLFLSPCPVVRRFAAPCSESVFCVLSSVSAPEQLRSVQRGGWLLTNITAKNWSHHLRSLS